MAYEMRVLSRPDGSTPFADWYRSIADPVTRRRITVRLARLRAQNPGDCHGVGEGVREMRLDFGPGYRIYFGLQGTHIVIIITGGDKSTQAKDIALAKQLWKEYQDA